MLKHYPAKLHRTLIYCVGIIFLAMPAINLFAETHQVKESVETSEVASKPLAKLYIHSDELGFSVSILDHSNEIFYQGVELPYGFYRLNIVFANGISKIERIYLSPGEQRDHVVLMHQKRYMYGVQTVLIPSAGAGVVRAINQQRDIHLALGLKKRKAKYSAYMGSVASNLLRLKTPTGKTVSDFSIEKRAIEKYPSLIGLIILSASATDHSRQSYFNQLLKISEGAAERLRDELLMTRLSRWAMHLKTGEEANFSVKSAERALGVYPVSAFSHYKLGIAYEIAGKQERAISQYEMAIKLDPNLAQAYNSLAWLLATTKDDSLRDGHKAVTYALKAVQLWPSPNYMDTLAVAQAEIGEWQKAIALTTKAIEVSKGEKLGVFVQEYQQHLHVYKMKKPWRERAVISFPDDVMHELEIIEELKREYRAKKIPKKAFRAFLYKVLPVM